MQKYKYNKDDISFGNTEKYCFEVARIIMENHSDSAYRMSANKAHNMIYPLWHILFKGLASPDFCKALLQAKPFMVARRIEKGGSHEEIIKRIETLVGCSSSS